MPIKPENRIRYPADWPAISASIRERAGHRCEWHDGEHRCAASQYAVGHWRCVDGLWRFWPVAATDPGGAAWTFQTARIFAADSIVRRTDGTFVRPSVIVLTVAHLNHQPEDCRPENLAAWCQRHHLAYDHAQHLAHAQATRRARVGQPELFK